MNRCPGQDRRFWKPQDIFEHRCPYCGVGIEFWKDDVRRGCPGCGKLVVNPRLDLACANWCHWAEQCLEGLTLEDRLVSAARDVFAGDERRFHHALRVLDYAKRLLETEAADARTAVATAVLHDIGIPASEAKHGSATPEHQHAEGPPVAREILTRLGVEAETTNQVCDIIGHHHAPKDDESEAFDVVYDADLLTNWQEAGPPAAGGELEGLIQTRFRTASGRGLARSVFLRHSAPPDS
jgi:hypothetical protein